MTEGKLLYLAGNGQWNIPQLRELLENILPRNTSFENCEVDHEFPNLGRRIMLLNARRIHNGEAKTQKILLAIEDITERKAMEHQLVSSEVRYRRLFETAQDGILILDAGTGEIIDVNPFLVDMLGYSKNELSGKKLWEIGFIKDEAESRHAFQVLQDKSYVRYEDLPLETKDGKPMQVEFVSNVYPINGDMVIQCNIRDITDRKKTEGENDKLNKALKQRAGELEFANKELETFSYTVSHDLRAPLRSITGFSKALFEDHSDKLDEEAKAYLTLIQESGERMSQMIDDLLKLSQVVRSEMNLNNVNLTELAQEVVMELKRAEPQRNVEFIAFPRLIVRGDNRLLRTVLENLLSNAWKFTSKVPEARIEFSTTERDGKKVYFVSDNGAGFDMTYASKLFLPFQRLHKESEFPGTGIGLASVQRVIRRHGGEIWAEGEVGKGAIFYFTLN